MYIPVFPTRRISKNEVQEGIKGAILDITSPKITYEQKTVFAKKQTGWKMIPKTKLEFRRYDQEPQLIEMEREPIIEEFEYVFERSITRKYDLHGNLLYEKIGEWHPLRADKKVQL